MHKKRKKKNTHTHWPGVVKDIALGKVVPERPL